MADSFDITWLFAIPVMAIACGVIGYIIATKRVKQPIVVFLGRYGISLLFLVCIEVTLLSLWPSFHATMRSLMATLVGGILTLGGVSHSVSASTITLQNPHLAFSIDAACLGGILFWIYIALVVAEPKASTRQRLFGILMGSAIILVFNFFRITLSIYLEWLTGVHVHDYFYLFNIVFVLLLWVAWLWTLKSRWTPFSKASS